MQRLSRLPSAGGFSIDNTMHVLVTGGCGFIGSHVVDRLVAEGHRVTVLDDLSTGRRENLAAAATLVVGDVADAATVQALVAAADAVVHLAAIASVQVCETQPERAERTNVTGTEHLFRAAAHKGIPMVYASSAAVYGDNGNLPLRETETPSPLGAYGRHKLACEHIAAQYAGVASVGLRFFNVYGPRQDPRSPYSGVISKFMAQAVAGEPLIFFGDGEQTRDFIFVGDVVALVMAALQHCTQHGGSHVLNGCTGKATSLKQLAAAIGRHVGKPLSSLHETPRAGDIRHSLGDPHATRILLGFHARTPLDAGLASLLGGE